jgi:lipid II:glycine glycyltransferase (peptidoglycan interpeptide bridge formation enzyme)
MVRPAAITSRPASGHKSRPTRAGGRSGWCYDGTGAWREERRSSFIRCPWGELAIARAVRVDVQREPDEILAQMRAGTRSNIRKAMRKGIVVREAGAGGLVAFGELLASTSGRQNFAAYPVDYYSTILRQFGDRAELLLAERNGQACSGAVIIGYGDTVVYKMGAWLGERSALHPNELMHWRAMQWARVRGYRYYDLEGISEIAARAILAGEEMPEEGRRGTTHFKLGMGGEVTIYPSAYDRSFHPLLVWPARMVAPRLARFRSVGHRLAGRRR